ncbi:putative retroelement [Abeliophyllum distichum]|uniref:Retroelement n=1 Tax=Abeliophyllum distichum TaxID=126358 RepID=A0ABD1PRC1_9LAMI
MPFVETWSQKVLFLTHCLNNLLNVSTNQNVRNNLARQVRNLVSKIGSIIPQKNSGKEPANQQFVHSVIKQFEDQQGIIEMERPSASRYESMTELIPCTMRVLLGELTQDVVEQVSLQNINEVEKLTQNGNNHYDHMAKQLSMLNELMNKMVNQIYQPNPLGLGNHFQTQSIVGNGSPIVNASQGIEMPHMGPAATNVGGIGTSNMGGSPNMRENVQNMGQNATRINDGGNPYLNGNNGPNNGTFIPNIGPNVVRPQAMPYIHQPIGVLYDPNAILRDQVIEIMQDQDAIELGRITFESKKKMAVDENSFLQPIDINMVSLNLDKLGLPRFKLVIKNGEDEPRPSAFERLKAKAAINE